MLFLVLVLLAVIIGAVYFLRMRKKDTETEAEK